MLPNPKQLILASQSKSRQSILQQTGLSFDVMPAGIDEAGLRESMKGISFKSQALALANAKAKVISEKYQEAVVIGADQICVFENHIFSKPGTVEKAKLQLKKLQSKTHQLVTAACLYKQGKLVWETVVVPSLRMRPLSEEQIDYYIKKDPSLNACGSYHIEGLGIHLFDDISADRATIQGLPIFDLLEALRALN